jgi:hypothetical protein
MKTLKQNAQNYKPKRVFQMETINLKKSKKLKKSIQEVFKKQKS